MNPCTYAEILSGLAVVFAFLAVMLGVANMVLVRRLGFKIS